MIRENVSPIHNLITEEIFKNMSGVSVAESLINAILNDGEMTSIKRITGMSCFPHNVIRERKCSRVDISAVNKKDNYRIYLQFGRYPLTDDAPYYPGRHMNFGERTKNIIITIEDTENWREDIKEYHVAAKMSNNNPKNEYVLFYVNNINLEKFRGIEVDKNNPLHRWLYYISEGYLNPQSEKTREIIGMDAGLKQFAEKYESLIYGNEIWEKYICQEHTIMYYEMNLIHERKEVIHEVAKEMFAEGIDFDVIRRIVKLLPENLQKIQAEFEKEMNDGGIKERMTKASERKASANAPKKTSRKPKKDEIDI